MLTTTTEPWKVVVQGLHEDTDYTKRKNIKNFFFSADVCQGSWIINQNKAHQKYTFAFKLLEEHK